MSGWRNTDRLAFTQRALQDEMTKVVRADGTYLHSPGSGMVDTISSLLVVSQGHYHLAVRSGAPVPSTLAPLHWCLTSFFLRRTLATSDGNAPGRNNGERPFSVELLRRCVAARRPWHPVPGVRFQLIIPTARHDAAGAMPTAPTGRSQ